MRIRQTVVLAAVLALAPATAHADEPCQHTCGGAAVSPAFSDSPVTLVICAVPDSCRIGGPR